jgi:hypothetical protein
MRRHLAEGTRVRVRKNMGLRVGRVTHVEGVVTKRDGEYYLITLDFEGVQLDRYLCEIGSVYINGEWELA